MNFINSIIGSGIIGTDIYVIVINSISSYLSSLSHSKFLILYYIHVASPVFGILIKCCRNTSSPSTVWISHWYGSTRVGGHCHRLLCDTAHQRWLPCQQVLLPRDGRDCTGSSRLLVPHFCTVFLSFLW